MRWTADMRDIYVIVEIVGKPGSKSKFYLMTKKDAQAVMDGRSKKISPEMVKEVNWEPTIGQIRFMQSKNVKVHEEPKKGPKVTCSKCGKKFVDSRGIGDEFIQEMIMGGPGTALCPSCTKKMGL